MLAAARRPLASPRPRPRGRPRRERARAAHRARRARAPRFTRRAIKRDGWMHGERAGGRRDQRGLPVTIPVGYESGSHTLVARRDRVGQDGQRDMDRLPADRAGHGAIVIDPKGDAMLRDELQRAAARAAARVPRMDTRRPARLQPLRARHATARSPTRRSPASSSPSPTTSARPSATSATRSGPCTRPASR